MSHATWSSSPALRTGWSSTAQARPWRPDDLRQGLQREALSASIDGVAGLGDEPAAQSVQIDIGLARPFLARQSLGGGGAARTPLWSAGLAPSQSRREVCEGSNMSIKFNNTQLVRK